MKQSQTKPTVAKQGQRGSERLSGVKQGQAVLGMVSNLGIFIFLERVTILWIVNIGGMVTLLAIVTILCMVTILSRHGKRTLYKYLLL